MPHFLNKPKAPKPPIEDAALVFTPEPADLYFARYGKERKKAKLIDRIHPPCPIEPKRTSKGTQKVRWVREGDVFILMGRTGIKTERVPVAATRSLAGVHKILVHFSQPKYRWVSKELLAELVQLGHEARQAEKAEAASASKSTPTG